MTYGYTVNAICLTLKKYGKATVALVRAEWPRATCIPQGFQHLERRGEVTATRVRSRGGRGCCKEYRATAVAS